jgi:hypothetical protein
LSWVVSSVRNVLKLLDREASELVVELSVEALVEEALAISDVLLLALALEFCTAVERSDVLEVVVVMICSFGL